MTDPTSRDDEPNETGDAEAEALRSGSDAEAGTESDAAGVSGGGSGGYQADDRTDPEGDLASRDWAATPDAERDDTGGAGSGTHDEGGADDGFGGSVEHDPSSERDAAHEDGVGVGVGDGDGDGGDATRARSAREDEEPAAGHGEPEARDDVSVDGRDDRTDRLDDGAAATSRPEAKAADDDQGRAVERADDAVAPAAVATAGAGATEETGRDERPRAETSDEEVARGAEPAASDRITGPTAPPAPGRAEAPAPAPDRTAPPAAERPAAAAPVSVSAPERPTRRGNRLFGIAVAAVATLAFTVLFAALAGLVVLIEGGDVLGLPRVLANPAFWVPVIVFFVAFALLVVIVGRARWVAYVFGGFAVGIAVYVGFVIGGMLSLDRTALTGRNALTALRIVGTNPLALGAFVLAREVPVWFGAWIGRRGRRLKAEHREDRARYEREVAEGPERRA